MKRWLVICLLTAPLAFAARVTAAVKPLIDNERVTVWDLGPADLNTADDVMKAAASMDTVAVYMAPETLQGRVDYVAKGTALRDTLRKSGATRMAVIALKDKVVPPLPNRSGLADAFPRPRSKKVIDNARVVVWDYTFEAGEPSPMHFHPRDVVTIYLKDGMLISTTPDGTKTNNEFTYGTIRFNPSNRTHTEVLTRGGSRIIAAELK